MRERESGGPGRDVVEAIVTRILALADDDEAARLLGIDGVLVDQVDVSFLMDAMDYLSYDLASAISDAEDAHASLATTTMLATLVAEVKLFRVVEGRLERSDLVQRVIEQLRQMEA